MIDAAALAAFAGHYPDRPALFDHDLHRHPLSSLPALTTLAARVPEGGAVWRPVDAPTFQATDNETVQRALAGDAPSGDLRLLELAGIEPYGAWINEIRQYLRPLLFGTSRQLDFSPGVLTADTGGVSDMPAPPSFLPLHTIRFQLHGETRFGLFPSRLDDSYGGQARDDRAGGGFLTSEGAAAAEMEHLLAPGSALFVPARMPYTEKTAVAPSVALVIGWRTLDLDIAEGSARWRQRLGRLPGPSRHPAWRKVEAWLARKFIG